MTDQQLLRWRSQIALILENATNLVIDDAIFRESMKALKNSKRSEIAPIVCDWVVRTYARSSLASIRRLLDKSRPTISLVRLLQSIRNKPSALSSASFADAYAASFHDDESWRDTAEIAFGRLATPDWRDARGDCGKAEHFPKAEVDRDLQDLESAWSRLKEITNLRVLHFRPDTPDEPSALWSDIHEAVDLIESVTIRYNFLLLRDDQRSGLLPGNWDEFPTPIREFWT